MAGELYLDANGYLTNDASQAVASADPGQRPAPAQQPMGGGEMSRPPVAPNGPGDYVSRDQFAEMAATDPMRAQALETQRMYDLGMVYQGGRAGRPAGWVPVQRTDAIAEPPEQYQARQDLAERARGIARDERDIQFEDNQIARDFLAEQAMQARERAEQAKSRLETIENNVNREQRDMDNQLAQHRRMIAEGLDPWRAFGDGDTSNKMAAILGVMTGTLAGGESASRTQQMFKGLMDQEIQRQMYEMETQGSQVDNAYGRLRDSLGDRQQAQDALRMLMLDQAKYELETSMLETADPKAQLEAQKLIQAIDEQLLADNDAFRVRAQGKLTEQYDQGQTAAAGGYRRMTPKEWAAWRESRAGVANTESGTAKNYKDIQASAMGPGEEDAAIESIPEAQLNKLSQMGGLVSTMSRLVKLMGATYDPITGKVIGDYDEEVLGMGPIDSSTAWLTEKGTKIKAALNDLTYSLARPEVGANFTGIEAEKVNAFTKAFLEGNQKALVDYMGERIAGSINGAMGYGMSARQKRAYSNMLRRDSGVMSPNSNWVKD